MIGGLPLSWRQTVLAVATRIRCRVNSLRGCEGVGRRRSASIRMVVTVAGVGVPVADPCPAVYSLPRSIPCDWGCAGSQLGQEPGKSY